ncbi:hypothetical protein ACIA8O_06985 [Kitasatospora sp. NPDC051853]|uniref:hypothetical protein n=1 Tax=Kitasatospora sp. NPDC051853 TaxID=3364058 RepID=UPI0037A648C2
MKSADTPFVGGPLDGRTIPVGLTPFNNVPRVYSVPVPAHGDTPAVTLVYRRAKEYDPKGRWRWRYEYQDPEAPAPSPGD